MAELHLGRPGAAAAALTRARAIAADAGLVHLERSAILNLIPALHQLGDYEQAMRLVDEGVALSPLFTSPNEAQAFVEARHVCRYIAGDIGGALDAWPDLVRHTEGAGDVHRQCSGWLVAAELPLLLGDVATAAPLVERALAATAASEIKRLAVQTHAKVGWLALLRGDLAAATDALEAGRSILDTSPDELSYLKTLELRLRRAGGRPGFDEDAIRVSRSGATAEVWSLMLAAAIAWRHAQGGVAEHRGRGRVRRARQRQGAAAQCAGAARRPGRCRPTRCRSGRRLARARARAGDPAARQPVAPSARAGHLRAASCALAERSGLIALTAIL